MSKVLYASTSTLLRRQDVDINVAAQEELTRVRATYPEFDRKGVLWHLSMKAQGGSPTVEVSVKAVEKRQGLVLSLSPGLSIGLIALVFIIAYCIITY